jgi:phosphatidylserine decarboxylase
MKLASQGKPFVGAGLLADMAGIGFIAAGTPAAGIPLLLLGTLFAAFCAYFFRDPERSCPADPQKLYSPADGVVLSVAREGPGEAVTVRIFLSIFDVHVQRAPCAGTVEKVEHISGSFRAAMKGEAKANERCVMTLSRPGPGGPVAVEQIAGFIARRIECWPQEGDALRAGERYGIIYFGSQAAVRFPPAARCALKAGERVQAGLTIIGEWIP